MLNTHSLSAASVLRQSLPRAVLSILLALAPSTAGAEELPSVLQVVGSITGRTPQGPARSGDHVEAVETATGAVVTDGEVIDNSGTYFVKLVKTKSYDGTLLTLRLKQDNAIHPLLDADGHPVQFPFQGGFPFPEKLVKTVALEPPSLVSTVSPCPPSFANCDINGDGQFNNEDLEAVKAALGQSPALPAADVTGDGVVNTNDIIAIRRALKEAGK